MEPIEERRLKDWEETLNLRVGRCGLTMKVPKRAWFDALAAIDEYRKAPDAANHALLKTTLKNAEIYVPKDL